MSESSSDEGGGQPQVDLSEHSPSINAEPVSKALGLDRLYAVPTKSPLSTVPQSLALPLRNQSGSASPGKAHSSSFGLNRKAARDLAKIYVDSRGNSPKSSSETTTSRDNHKDNPPIQPSTAVRRMFADAILSPPIAQSFQSLSLDSVPGHAHPVLNSLSIATRPQAAVPITGAGPSSQKALLFAPSLPPPVGTSRSQLISDLVISRSGQPEAPVETLSATTSVASTTWSTRSSNETPLTSLTPSERLEFKSMTHPALHQKNSTSLGLGYGNIDSLLTGCPAAPIISSGQREPLSQSQPHTDSVSTRPAEEVGSDTICSEAPCANNTINSVPLSGSRLGLASPCVVHRRFEQVVDHGRLIDEMQGADPDPLSHTRLAKIAIGVREVSRQLQRNPIHRSVRTILIVTKARDNSLVDQTRELAEWLLSVPRNSSSVSGSMPPSGQTTPSDVSHSSFEAVGVTVYVDAKLRSSPRFGALDLIARDPVGLGRRLRFWTPELCASHAEKFDLVLTLGGDGTVLFTSWLFQQIVPPILSFSLGSLGFLTNFEFQRYRDQLEPMIKGESGMRVSLRMRFTCTVYRAPQNQHLLPTRTAAAPSMFDDSSDFIPSGLVAGEQYQVLNELVVDRGPSPYVSNLEVYGDNNLITIVQADGCIFSTPTGSTAYSLAAGGSLVHPDIPALLLTPICPHTLSFRPMLLNDTIFLRVSIPTSSRTTDGAYCSFDGKSRIQLRPGDSITISASRYPFPSVQASPTEWFDSLRGPLLWNSRTAQKGWDHQGAKGSTAGGQSSEPERFDIDFDSPTPDELSAAQELYEQKLLALQQRYSQEVLQRA